MLYCLIMNTITKNLYSIAKLTQRLESEPKSFGTDVLLTGTDVHLIEIIGTNDNNSVTGIANSVGVTKGAVSQKLQQLEQKGLVQKVTDPENLSRSIVTLTSKGKVAFFAHQHWHETMDGGFNKYYNSLNKEQYQTIDEFLTKMEDLLTRLLSVK